MEIESERASERGSLDLPRVGAQTEYFWTEHFRSGVHAPWSSRTHQHSGQGIDPARFRQARSGQNACWHLVKLVFSEKAQMAESRSRASPAPRLRRDAFRWHRREKISGRSRWWRQSLAGSAIFRIATWERFRVRFHAPKRNLCKPPCCGRYRPPRGRNLRTPLDRIRKEGGERLIFGHLQVSVLRVPCFPPGGGPCCSRWSSATSQCLPQMNAVGFIYGR